MCARRSGLNTESIKFFHKFPQVSQGLLATILDGISTFKGRKVDYFQQSKVLRSSNCLIL